MPVSLQFDGRQENIRGKGEKRRKTYELSLIHIFGGGQTEEKVLERLKEYGMDHVTVHAGSRVSYEDERIV